MRTTRPPPAPPAPLRDTSFGRYTLIDRIAVGGMAEVFRARIPSQAGEPRTIVIKRMLSSLASDPEAVAMFNAEARLGRLVRHDNVVAHLGEGTEEGMPFLVLELVPGLDLWRLTRWLMREGRTIGVELAVYIARSLLAGLHAIHEARDETEQWLGIVHRDVSPSNVLLSVHGDIKVADLGIARAHLRETRPQAPVSARAKGKLGYLSPEQVQGLEIDRRADIFSAAVILAELLMGKPLFSGGSELAVLLSIRDAGIRPFLEVAKSLPNGLDKPIAAALASDMHQRTPTAAAFRDALSPFQTLSLDVLRAHLAELVQAASSAMTGSQVAATPIEINEQRQTTPPIAMEVQEALLEPPTTGDAPELLYRVKVGDITKALPFAALVEAIATAKFGPDDMVQMGDQTPQPLRGVPELARHLPPSSITRESLESGRPRSPDLSLTIGGGGIVRAMALIALRGDTGLLLCQVGDVRKEVYFTDGSPTFVTSNLAGELLGEYLVAKNVISRAELDMALAVMPRFEGRLGDTLAALGLVEPVHLFRHIAGQVREKLLDLYSWENGTATMYRGVEPPQSGFPLGLEAWTLLREGARRRLELGLEDLRFSSPTAQVIRTGASMSDLSRLPVEGDRVLDLAAESSPLALLRGAAGQSDPVEATAIIVILFHLGLLQWT